MTLQDLNSMDQRELRELMFQCCGSKEWSKMMLIHFPAEDLVDLLESAEEVWSECSEEDWKEAFSHHPRIGDLDEVRKKYSTSPAANEQSAVAGAPEETLAALAAANAEYEKKFGYIFIVCATGKSAEEMLGLIHARMQHNPATELKVAADEQAKITRLRLEKLLA
jgi:2-oxo-4-hydroxy-4-carboxy-5-ureidoimidazoline decarboxylase